jgi:hypothetical protein
MGRKSLRDRFCGGVEGFSDGASFHMRVIVYVAFRATGEVCESIRVQPVWYFVAGLLPIRHSQSGIDAGEYGVTPILRVLAHVAAREYSAHRTTSAHFLTGNLLGLVNGGLPLMVDHR